MNIYVGDLDVHVTEGRLFDLFRQYGKVNSVKIITDFETGSSKGFGFVEMDDKADAAEAIKCLAGIELMSKNISVAQAIEKEPAESKFVSESKNKKASTQRNSSRKNN